MRKVVVLMMLGLVAAGCEANNAPLRQVDQTVKSHFYPIVHGSKYTYVRFNNKSYDTVTYQVKVGERRGDLNVLSQVDQVQSAPHVLYYFGYTSDQYGHTSAVLKDTTEFVALSGTLQKGDEPWIAQESPLTYAKVIAEYDEFYPQGRDNPFMDVICVKYWPEGSESEYTLRFYAKNYGLIRENKIVGRDTEIGSLQLLNYADNQSSYLPQDGLPPIDHKLGRHRMSIAQWHEYYDPR